ncbi:methyltransferase domain-containing protein [Aliidiomarina sanyensis]|uniref:Methyltransferase type 11 n=1 Tax=Aliidiomarina sanyensis TaxID=1249555 RepID=A0A432WKQ3_9GAMM|nr:methyltransferase domain-containing protein [Aliidiomarina sanyensis]RUO34269.1 methyltransferase type 11 [Aliidiomarina sanyensis]
MTHLIDQQTTRFYEDNAEDIFLRYEAVAQSGISKHFSSSFAEGASVLDVGAGSGRDVRELLSQGFDAYGVEPSDALRKLALKHHPELTERLFAGQLPDKLSTYKKYDGVVCSAVLMHLPPNVLFDSILALRDLLNVNGRLLISIPASRPDIGTDDRDRHGRLFNPITPGQLKLLCKRLAFECIAEHDDGDALGRAETSWHTFLFVRRSSLGKPLDRIESVLRNDRKTATYKLALLRAFCDVAEQDEHAVTWYPDGNIGIPTKRIAELWLAYYWPLVASRTFIPQINAEGRGGKPISFRFLLDELIKSASEYFQITDVSSPQLFSMFMLAWKKQTLPEPINKTLRSTLTKIRTAIINGPVNFAAEGKMFHHEKATDRVVVEAELWLEFCLTGYWVRDSLILRWAELCSRFGDKLPNVTLGLVMDRLLEKPEVAREQSFARKIYLEIGTPQCVWSEKSLRSNSMDIDHALPYSLWYNNDLWNLLPTHKKVNNQKRDRVPNNQVLLNAKDRIIEIWRCAHQIEPAVFEHEVTRSLGEFVKSDWERPLFDHLKRKAEVAIFQRGAAEWRGWQDPH